MFTCLFPTLPTVTVPAENAKFPASANDSASFMLGTAKQIFTEPCSEPCILFGCLFAKLTIPLILASSENELFTQMTVYLTRRERFNAAHRLFRPEWTDEKNFEVSASVPIPTARA
jgi:hypothetical protein